METNSQTETKPIGKGDESGKEEADLIQKTEIHQKERRASYNDSEDMKYFEKSPR